MKDLLEIVDDLSDANDFVECAFMASQTLEKEFSNPLGVVLTAASDKLSEISADIDAVRLASAARGQSPSNFAEVDTDRPSKGEPTESEMLKAIRAEAERKLEGYLNRITRVENLARGARMACESPESADYVDCIRALVDVLVAEVVEIVDDIEMEIAKAKILA